MRPISVPFIVLAILVGVFVLFRNKENVPEEVMNGTARDRQELIFVLQYIGRDYQFAVAGGKVINQFEYREMMAFCDRVIEIYLAFDKELKHSEIILQLQELRQMVFEKAEHYSIADLSKTLVRNLTKNLRIESFPVKPPNIASGQRLYKVGGCNVCHGAKGAGDGWAAGWLDPGPGSFGDAQAMREATPYQFYNVIQLGVTGTSMPSYREAFTKQEVWDVAFFLMTLREGFNPQARGERLDITLSDLATKSDIDLLQEISDRQGSQDSMENEKNGEKSAAIDFLRSNPDQDFRD